MTSYEEWLKVQNTPTFILNGYSVAMQDIVNGRSPVEYEFDLSHALDVDRATKMAHGWSFDEGCVVRRKLLSTAIAHE